MDGTGVAKSRTRLSSFHFTSVEMLETIPALPPIRAD